jgi:hypothetical protein
MRKILLTVLLGAGLCYAPLHAEIVVHKKPPHAVSEHPPAPPGHGYVWIGGYQRWDGDRFVWEPGHWQLPPHEHAIWMAPRWERTNGGYMFIEGWWV